MILLALILSFCAGFATAYLVRIAFLKFGKVVMSLAARTKLFLGAVIGLIVEMLVLFFIAVLPVEILLVLPAMWLLPLFDKSAFLAIGYFVGIIAAFLVLNFKEHAEEEKSVK